MYKFKTTARLLHWLSALIIIWATITVFLLAIFDFGEECETLISEFNVSLTFVFIPFFIWRLLFRLTNEAPPSADYFSRFEVLLANYMHGLIYLLVTVVLISGVLMIGDDFQVFNLFFVPHIFDEAATLNMFSLIHECSIYLLTFSISVHLLAVIKHEYNGIRILKRML